MEKHFKGYYKLKPRQIKSIWDNGFISLDANSIFNLYRYSEDTRKVLLSVFSKYSSQLWLTHQAAFEFHKNRLGVISEQIDIYTKAKDTFKKLESEIIKNVRSPHLSKTVLKSFEKLLRDIDKDLTKQIKYYTKLLTNDSILSAISNLFKKKVGDQLNSTELKAIEKEGEERYRNKIPPGYKDNNKESNKYGDLVLWKELILKSKTDNLPFILITDDAKEDWWTIIRGKTIMPRQELSQELYLDSKQIFYLYTTERFLDFASQTNKISQDVIDEVRDISLSTFVYNLNEDQINKWSTFYNTGIFPINNDKLLNFTNHMKSLSDFSSLTPNVNQIMSIIRSNPNYFNPKINFSTEDLQKAAKALSNWSTIQPPIKPINDDLSTEEDSNIS